MSDCCGPNSDCCSDEACVDDPFLGEKQEVLVEYLYLDQSVCDRCQGTDGRVEQAIRVVAPVFDMAGYTLKMVRIEMADEQLAVEHKFLSSPTVRVNGVDICPEVIENECDCCKPLSDYDVYCRQFDFNGKLYEVPPVAYVVKRMCEIVFGGEQPVDEPYELPANLKGFFDGKIAKEQREAQQQSDFVATAKSLAEKAGSEDADAYAAMAERIWKARPKSKPGARSCCC